ncbi:MAG: cyclodeaminase/cyclohydrolase family protein [Eggerthellaceae bacterium]|nr:cyclodeaminase/cyclohydrolase family protein [Eggerthellaceae bacterium]
MPEKLMDGSCTAFADALAAKVSVPGGGGAAAYVGALGVALCSMVGNFTTGKKKYAEYEEDIQRMLAEGEEIRARLLELVDEDAEAFYPLSQAYVIPKEDPGRAEVLERCTKRALTGPLEMMRQVARSVELLEEMQAKGSRLLLSDVGCGAACAAAALRAAAMNVFINTNALTDRDFASRVEAEADALLAYVPRAEAVADAVCAALRE